MKKKKLLTGIVTMGLVLSLSSTTAFAAGAGRGRNFVDANKDGVCDNYAAGNCGKGTGRGTGRGAGRNAGRGAGYVDANGDGICDNYANGGAGGAQNGSGVQQVQNGKGRRGR